MARNRLDSTTSMKFAIGWGCARLLLGAVGVVFSVAKIVVGSEYVNDCPSRMMIPVYVIVSGCLPVLLSALRQPYDGGHAMDKARWSMKVSLLTAVFGVIVNLAWLVAGTYLVVTTLKENICDVSLTGKLLNDSENTAARPMNVSNFPELVNQEEDPLHSSKPLATDAYSAQNRSLKEFIRTEEILTTAANKGQYIIAHKTDMTSKVENITNTTSTYKVVSRTSAPGESTPDTNLELNGEPAVKVTDDGVLNTGESPRREDMENDILTTRVNATIGHHDIGEGLQLNTSVPNASNSTNTINRDGFIERDTLSEIVSFEPGSKAETSQGHCMTCEIHILRFSLAAVIIDWLFVFIGIIYFCHFVSSRFGSLKDQLLLINA